MKKWTINDFFSIEEQHNEDHQLCGIEFSCKICGFTFTESPTSIARFPTSPLLSHLTKTGICLEPERAEDHIMKYHIKEIK